MTYRFWGKWDEPLLAGAFWVHYYKAGIHQKLGLNLSGNMIFLGANYYQWVEDWKKVEELVKEHLLNKNTSLLEKSFALVQETINRHHELQRIRNIKPKMLSDTEILRLLEKYIDSAQRMVACWVLIFQLEPGIESFLRERAEQVGIPFTDIFALITPPREVLLVQQERLFHEIKQEIAHVLHRMPSQKRSSFLQQELPKTYEKIQHYLREFSWVGTHSYRGEGITEESLFTRLQEENQNPGKKEKRKDNIPAEIEQAVRVGSELCYYRLQIAEHYDKIAFLYRPFFTEIARRLGLTYDLVLWYTYDELRSAFEQKKGNPHELKKREELSGLLLEQGNEKVLVGEACRAEIRKYEEKIEMTDRVKGLIAFKGKAQGKAKLLAVPKDIAKVQQGDIIIAPETTPDFIAAMRKAAAFVTDIGGITSHAAIVARELKKPCIVGTKIATKIFKDDEMVEVDAEKGMVKRVKK